MTKLAVMIPTLLLSAAVASAAPASQPAEKSKAEIEKLIESAGKAKPEWWDQTPLKYPDTLDLKWPGNVGWNASKDPGCYLWDNIYPNPSKWREGAKLMMHVMSVNKDNEKIQKKAMRSLAGIYTDMLQDYARGAYWAKKVGDMDITLAECYMKLGAGSMARDVLNQLVSDDSRNGQGIKLWSELGDMETAAEWAEGMADEGYPTAGYLALGDGYRRAGDLKKAMASYEKVLAVPTAKELDQSTNKRRARANLDAIKLYELLDVGKISDGSYKGASQGYVGPVEVTVNVKNHRIEKAEVTNHKEKQFYSSLTDVPPQIIAKQSVKGIDMTTGATVTSEAIVNAAAKALAGGQK